MAASDRIIANAVAVAGMVVWATNFPVSEVLLESWSPLMLTPLRAGLAGIVVTFAAVALGQGRETVRLLFDARVAVAGLAFGFSTIFFVAGQKHTDAVTASVIVSAMPLISAVMGWMAGRERFTTALVLALLLALAGGTLTSVAGDGGSVEGSVLGALSILCGSILYVWYSRMIVDLIEVPVLAKTAASTLIGAAFVAVAVLAAGLTGWLVPEYDLSPGSIGLIGWLGFAVGSSAILWFWVGQRIGVTVAAVHNNLVPFYVILMAAAMGSSVSGRELLGAFFVIAAAVLAQWPAPGLSGGASRRTGG